MVLSVKQQDRFWLFTSFLVVFAYCLNAVNTGEIGAAYQMTTFAWGFWDFFRCIGDYEYDVKGISCQ
ncbi:hypothetical protein FDJ19_gp160 [Vibrio phage Ceto]|uniref:Uncharacterized protein n=1 Tax=Vibrio phage Ceto TaxID=2570300 RepID=A0A2H5BGN8_9CAUD|nr:hypothetical protein FDJ19_gp160 [Vibrio phage Ceto]AUG85138.1 hypothetical protein CETO_156 [Vibrio phage Ceto]